MLEWLFGSSGPNVEPLRARVSSGADSLLKQATAEKRSGDVDAAIRTLRLAYGQIAKKTAVTYSVDVFLRLPLYLQEAGQNDEAWSEFNRLIAEGYPNQLSNPGVKTMDHSKIYDKMRLFLQREGKNKEAIVFGALSFLACARGLFLQKRKRELEKFVSRKCIKATLEPLVKKAKRTAQLEQLVDLMVDESGDPAHLDFSGTTKRIRQLIANAASG